MFSLVWILEDVPGMASWERISRQTQDQMECLHLLIDWEQLQIKLLMMDDQFYLFQSKRIENWCVLQRNVVCRTI